MSEQNNQNQTAAGNQDMFDKSYQLSQINRRKHLAQYIDLADRFLCGVFRRLIHFFGVLACLATIYVLVLINSESQQLDRYEMQASREVSAIQNLFKFNHKLGPKIKKGTAMLEEFARRFVDSGQEGGRGGAVIHPLYVSLQEQSPLRLSNNEAPYALKDNEYSLKSRPISTKLFYRRHVSKSLPCVLRKEIADEKVVLDMSSRKSQEEVDRIMLKTLLTASKKDNEEGQDQPEGDEPSSALTITILNKEKRISYNLYGDYQMFMEEKGQGHFTRDNYIFIEDAAIQYRYKSEIEAQKESSQGMDVYRHHLQHFLDPIKRSFTQWKDFPNRQVKRLVNEQHICVLFGSEEFRLVSPIYKKNLYINVFDQYHEDDTPINFFKLNTKKYPLTKDINWLTTILNAGDCMYVPAFFYVQSRTVGKDIQDQTIMITEEYQSHNLYTDLFMQGLNSHGCENQDKVDKEIKNIFGSLGFK